MNKVADLKACDFTKKRLQRRCTAASVHLKIKRRIYHPVVKYLRCFCRKLLVRCLTLQIASLEKKVLQGWTNFLLGPRTFGARKTLVVKTKVFVLKTRNIFSCFLLPKPDSFHINSASIDSFCNEAFVV